MAKPNSLRVALRRFMELHYPGKCRGRNVYGIELILLDAELYHAVRRIAYGRRKPQALDYVGRLELEARMVLHALENDAYDYFEQARELAQMALSSIPLERDAAVRLVDAVIAVDSPP
ncbi:MAG: hypothetical protein JWL77_1948 [Chthonomonadaceae bacterium]|nr:hypothetical protein [Chthonomonadaceae bacterium]